jgi:hypothetical protein
MNRQTKLTPETQEKIAMVIRAGNYIETAAAYAGISKQCLYEWLRRGAATNAPPQYRAFAAAIREALAAAEVRDVAQIAKASEKEWTAAAWRLERRHPVRWARTREREQDDEELARILGRQGEIVTTAEGAKRLTLTLDAKALSPGDLWTLRQIAQRAAAGERPALPLETGPPPEPDAGDDEPPVFMDPPASANGHPAPAGPGE